VTKNGDLNPFLLFRLCGVKPLLAILAAKKINHSGGVKSSYRLF
jgi:hypothetical protein